MSVADAQPSGARGPLERIGAWAFAQRSWIPVPLALLLITVRWHWLRSGWLLAAGLAMVISGLGIRCWAVRHIGTISRTRSARLGPMMSRGPFALVRNPLYVGNFLMWIGFAVSSGLLWMVPVAWAISASRASGAVARSGCPLRTAASTSSDSTQVETPSPSGFSATRSAAANASS